MPELSVAQWAEHENISRQAAYKRIKSGKVKLNERGLINSEQADLEWKSNRDCLQQQRGAPALRHHKPVAPKTVPASPVELPQCDPPAQVGLDLRSIELADDTSLAESQRITALLRARREKLDHERAEGRLVDAEQVELAIRQRGSEEQQALLSLAADKAPDGAAYLGVDERKLHEWLDRIHREFLERRGTI